MQTAAAAPSRTRCFPLGSCFRELELQGIGGERTKGGRRKNSKKKAGYMWQHTLANKFYWGFPARGVPAVSTHSESI